MPKSKYKNKRLTCFKLFWFLMSYLSLAWVKFLFQKKFMSFFFTWAGIGSYDMHDIDKLQQSRKCKYKVSRVGKNKYGIINCTQKRMVVLIFYRSISFRLIFLYSIDYRNIDFPFLSTLLDFIRDFCRCNCAFYSNTFIILAIFYYVEKTQLTVWESTRPILKFGIVFGDE